MDTFKEGFFLKIYFASLRVDEVPAPNLISAIKCLRLGDKCKSKPPELSG